jgi:hypothetical protein
MTPQQQADITLARWQALRWVAPEERIEILMRDFFAPVPPCDVEYEATLRNVAMEMAA